MTREPQEDGWLEGALRQSTVAATDACLDAETLAAWADGGLSGQAAAAVELHASSCSHCMGILAAMERSAPAAPVRHAWTPGRFLRWLVPLTAAATAIAIWIAVPERPVTRQRIAVEREQVPVPVPVPEAGRADESLNRRRSEPLSAPESLDVLEKAESMADARSPAAPPAAAAPQTASRSFTSTDTLAEAPESLAPSNPLIRWRVVGQSLVERSVDGGQTWTSAVALPAAALKNTVLTAAATRTVISVRAVDADRAVVRTSDSSEFYTTNGGLSWTRVQENSQAPF